MLIHHAESAYVGLLAGRLSLPGMPIDQRLDLWDRILGIVFPLVGVSARTADLRVLVELVGRVDLPHDPQFESMLCLSEAKMAFDRQLTRIDDPSEQVGLARYLKPSGEEARAFDARAFEAQHLDGPEADFFRRQTDAERARLMRAHCDIAPVDAKPLRFRVIDSDLPARVKQDVLRRLDAPSRHMPPDFKLQQWIESALELPLGRHKPMAVDADDPVQVARLISDARARMDAVVSGQDRAKDSLLEVMASYVSSGRLGGGAVIGLHGRPGTGKTSLLRDAVAPALGLPIAFVNLNGSPESVLGFAYTYEGSRCGSLAECLMRSGCMNPIIVLDEADKLDEGPRGQEMSGLLLQLTDSSAAPFCDRYFAGIDLPLSNALIVLTYNDPSRLNDILRDRIIEVHMDSFTPTEQAEIARAYTVPKLMRQLSLPDTLTFAPHAIEHLTRQYTDGGDGGMRPVGKVLQRLLRRLNLLWLTRTADSVRATGKAPAIRQLLQTIADGRDVTVDAALIDELLRPTVGPVASEHGMYS